MLERLAFCNKFHENRCIGFVDTTIFIFLNGFGLVFTLEKVIPLYKKSAYWTFACIILH